MSVSWVSLLLALVKLIERLVNNSKIREAKKQQDEHQSSRQKAIELERLLLAIKTRRMVRNEKSNSTDLDGVTTNKLRKPKGRYQR